MKCSCGGGITKLREKITIRGKQYKPIFYRCDTCDKRIERTIVHIPIRKN